MFKANVEKNQSIFSGGNKRETGFAMSPNGQYFVVSTDDIKKNSNSYTAHVYDSEILRLIYKKAYQKSVEKFYEANDLSIDDEKNVYTLGKLFLDGRSQKKAGKANYDFLLNKISSSNVQTIKIDVKNEETHIRSLSISNINNKIHLFGFYSEEGVGKIKGGSFFDVDTENMLITVNKFFELPDLVYKDLCVENKIERQKEKELSDYYVDYTMNDNHGNTYILAEEFYVTTQFVTYGMNGGGSSVSTPHYGNLLVLKLDKEGNLEWGRGIFKHANRPSYNAFVKNDKLHIVLNSGKTFTEMDDGRVKVSKDLFESTSLYDIAFSEKGEVNYNKKQDNKKHTIYRPYYGIYDENRFITIGERGGKKRFLILN